MDIHIDILYSGVTPMVRAWFDGIATGDLPTDADEVAAVDLAMMKVPVPTIGDPSWLTLYLNPFTAISEATATSVVNADLDILNYNLADLSELAGVAVQEELDRARTRVLAIDTDSFTVQPWTPYITASTGANGAISPTGATAVPYVDVAGVATPDNKVFTMTPDAGFTLATCVVDGVDAVAGADPGLSDTTPSVDQVITYTFTSVDEDHTIACTWA